VFTPKASSGKKGIYYYGKGQVMYENPILINFIASVS